jgi:hypothetical protein
MNDEKKPDLARKVLDLEKENKTLLDHKTLLLTKNARTNIDNDNKTKENDELLHYKAKWD